MFHLSCALDWQLDALKVSDPDLFQRVQANEQGAENPFEPDEGEVFCMFCHPRSEEALASKISNPPKDNNRLRYTIGRGSRRGTLVLDNEDISVPVPPRVDSPMREDAELDTEALENEEALETEELEGNDTGGYLGDRDNDWDPWKGHRAAPGWVPKHWATIVLFGPSSEYFSLIAQCGDGNQDKEESSRKTHRKKDADRKQASRDMGGPDRGMSIQVKTNVAALAQNEDAADQREIDREFATITQLISIKQREMDLKMKMAENLPDKAVSLYAEINVLSVEVRSLSKRLDKVGTAKRERNPIVHEVLGHARTSLGLKRTKISGDVIDVSSP